MDAFIRETAAETFAVEATFGFPVSFIYAWNKLQKFYCERVLLKERWGLAAMQVGLRREQLLVREMICPELGKSSSITTLSDAPSQVTTSETTQISDPPVRHQDVLQRALQSTWLHRPLHKRITEFVWERTGDVSFDQLRSGPWRGSDIPSASIVSELRRWAKALDQAIGVELCEPTISKARECVKLNFTR